MSCYTLILQISLPSLQDYDVKFPQAKSYGGRKNTRQQISPPPSKLGCDSQELNSREITNI